MKQCQSLITPVILCGGSGTRLWPLSRATFPKQFLQLEGEKSLFQQTLQRVHDNPLYDAPLVLTNQEHRFYVGEQARQIDVPLDTILLEPCSRNTAPAIGAAIAYNNSRKPDNLIHVLPSDHLIQDDEPYRAAILEAAQTARAGYLTTFGITPTYPATGYGYIKAGPKLEKAGHKVERFIEKPDEATAKTMVDEGGYFWNSGMFLLSPESFMQELGKFEPEMSSAILKAVKLAESDLDFVRLDEATFSMAPDISVDYAVFEKTERAALIPAPISWSDIGSWQSLWQSKGGDDAGNVVYGAATLNAADNNIVVSDGQHIALNGVSNLAVIATDDALLVSSLEQSEDIKKIVASLKESEATSPLTQEHKTVYRPWGGYTSILKGERFQVKKLFVKSGAQLSLQKHHHRAEHWVVVSGTAEVTIDDEVKILSENQSVYIPLGSVHRLKNPGKIQLEVVEVQSGSYLGEDDIVRFQDDFGR